MDCEWVTWIVLTKTKENNKELKIIIIISPHKNRTIFLYPCYDVMKRQFYTQTKPIENISIVFKTEFIRDQGLNLDITKKYV
jgi:hypothetical protein